MSHPSEFSEVKATEDCKGFLSLSLIHTHTRARARARAHTHTHTHTHTLFVFLMGGGVKILGSRKEDAIAWCDIP